MKRFVNGIEVELNESGADVTDRGDCLAVRNNGKLETALAIRVGDSVHVSFRGAQFQVNKSVRTAKRTGSTQSGEIRSPMPGLIVDVLVKEGETVTNGQKLLVLEAMKTQQPFNAPFDGLVKSVSVTKGQQVSDSELLVVVEPT